MEKNLKEIKKDIGKKTVWFDARNLSEEGRTLPLVYSMRYNAIILKYNDLQKIKAPHRMKLIVEVDDEKQLESIPKEACVLSDKPELLRQAKANGYGTALFKSVTSQEEMEMSWKLGNQFSYLVIELKDETNIPLELIIARLQNRETILLKIVSNVQDMEIAFGVMESGSDGVVIRTEDVQEIVNVDKFISREEVSKLELVKAKVTEVSHIGMGYRACIDTTTLFKKNEGMIIGSTSNGGLLVSSETHYLPYMELRPFRVNAGAVHSYVWAPDLMTNYITELKGGSRVLCVDTDGNAREVNIGRVKTESRPLLKIEVEAKGIKVNAIVQDDWHIRIFGGNGEPRNASTIKVGDELLAYICSGGRHVGVKIDEYLEEK